MPFFQLDGHAVLTLRRTNTIYLTLFQFMYNEYHNGNSYSADILRAQLQLILHKAHAQAKNGTYFQ